MPTYNVYFQNDYILYILRKKNSTKVVTETNMHLLGTKMRSLEVNKVRFTF